MISKIMFFSTIILASCLTSAEETTVESATENPPKVCPDSRIQTYAAFAAKIACPIVGHAADGPGSAKMRAEIKCYKDALQKVSRGVVNIEDHFSYLCPTTAQQRAECLEKVLRDSPFAYHTKILQTCNKPESGLNETEKWKKISDCYTSELGKLRNGQNKYPEIARTSNKGGSL